MSKGCPEYLFNAFTRTTYSLYISLTYLIPQVYKGLSRFNTYTVHSLDQVTFIQSHKMNVGCLLYRFPSNRIYSHSSTRIIQSAMASQQYSSQVNVHPPLPPRDFQATRFEVIDPSQMVEEERLPFYNSNHYYPMRIGEILKDCYQVVAKLGYGASSIVWLCRDLRYSQPPSYFHCPIAKHDLLPLRDRSHRVIKAYVNTLEHNQELEVFKHLASITVEHSGRLHVPQLEDSFRMKSRNGEHDFFVMTPLGMSMRSLQELQVGGIFAQSVVKGALDQVLLGLNFLHEADVIHTGKIQT
jgi:hypothetical protein